jgi:hypothetical protein
MAMPMKNKRVVSIIVPPSSRRTPRAAFPSLKAARGVLAARLWSIDYGEDLDNRLIQIVGCTHNKPFAFHRKIR